MSWKLFACALCLAASGCGRLVGFPRFTDDGGIPDLIQIDRSSSAITDAAITDLPPVDAAIADAAIADQAALDLAPDGGAGD